MDLGRFRGWMPTIPNAGDSTITILRIDPQNWELKLLCISETGRTGGYTPRRWCELYGLVAAINAGMYEPDHSTHTGYLRNGSHVNNSQVNHYQAVAAFRPRSPDLPLFRIYDLDAEGSSMDFINQRYDSVVQNLRLIKRPGENRWPRQEKRWSEVALGEDRSGRVLFIFCRTPYTMHDFNEMLTALPIDLVCAQHLDGGPIAQLYVRTRLVELELVGSYETNSSENDLHQRTLPMPNVIGVLPRTLKSPPERRNGEVPRSQGAPGAGLERLELPTWFWDIVKDQASNLKTVDKEGGS